MVGTDHDATRSAGGGLILPRQDTGQVEGVTRLQRASPDSIMEYPDRAGRSRARLHHMHGVVGHPWGRNQDAAIDQSS